MKLDTSHLNYMITPKLSHKKFDEVCKIIAENNVAITEIIYANNKVQIYYDYLFFMVRDSGDRRNIVHGGNSASEPYYTVSINKFISSLSNIHKKFDIYGNRLNKGK